jgi:hypothetical protein
VSGGSGWVVPLGMGAPAGNSDVAPWGPGELHARLVEKFREAGRPEIADAMVAWLSGGPDLAARIRSEEWEELVGEAIWSGGEED